jgi:Competence protein CoiA-like family
MLYAITPANPKTQPTEKGQRARCPNPNCLDPELIGKFGTIVKPHWAHKSGVDCDDWGEPEGPWHLAWKDLVKPKFCEVTIRGLRDGSECFHRADVQNDRGTVIELQHSPISPETIAQRETFYGRMVWVFDVSYLVGSPRFDKSFGEGESGSKLRVGYASVGPPPHPSPHGKRVLRPIHVNDNLRLILGCGIGDIQVGSSKIRYRWKHAKKTIGSANCPVYLDFGQPVDLQFEHTYQGSLQANPYGHQLLKVTRFKTTKLGTFLTGKPTHLNKFLHKHMRDILKDPDLEALVQLAATTRFFQVHAFRFLRRIAAKDELDRLAAAERQRKEAAEAEARRREQQRLRDEQRREAARQELQQFKQHLTEASYDTLVRIGRKRLPTNEQLAFNATAPPRLRKLEAVIVERLNALDWKKAAAFQNKIERQLKGVRASFKVKHVLVRLKSTDAYGREVHNLLAPGPYDEVLKEQLKYQYGFRFGLYQWNGKKVWGRPGWHIEDDLTTRIDEANERLARKQLPPRLAFAARYFDDNPPLTAQEWAKEFLKALKTWDR